jgi:predicted negative regulator of RcsB-dependent stress response
MLAGRNNYSYHRRQDDTTKSSTMQHVVDLLFAHRVQSCKNQLHALSGKHRQAKMVSLSLAKGSVPHRTDREADDVLAENLCITDTMVNNSLS